MNKFHIDPEEVEYTHPVSKTEIVLLTAGVITVLYVITSALRYYF